MSENISKEQAERVQLSIDSGLIWQTQDGSEFAMQLLNSHKCQLAPGVLTMFPTTDNRFIPVYNIETLNSRLISGLGSPDDISKLLQKHGLYHDNMAVDCCYDWFRNLMTVNFDYSTEGWTEEFEYQLSHNVLFYTNEPSDEYGPYTEIHSLTRNDSGEWLKSLKQKNFEHLIKNKSNTTENLSPLLKEHSVKPEHQSALERAYQIYINLDDSVKQSLNMLINHKTHRP